MSFQFDWFLTLPGMFITGGVLLLLVALIILIVTNKKSKKAKETSVSKEKSKEPIQLQLLDISYKVDFLKRVVAVNNEWLELPTEYDMDNNSYNNMVAVAKNYKNNKDKSARLQ